MDVRLKRVYEDPSPEDGRRVLVDGLWPRGIAKASAPWDEWCREVAPSKELRSWYGHDPERFAEFGYRYETELGDPIRAQALDHLRSLAAGGPLTLLTATHEAAISHAAVLRSLLGVSPP